MEQFYLGAEYREGEFRVHQLPHLHPNKGRPGR